ncbi:DNA helicase MCM9-like [Anopheles bellator]|uniref:DNA helicase MCM9-like n=1 Tax=Anopheles bellator TaxID=139047 RepID=UPI002648D1DF|nr:DNA helicase MCM9-like [Anopheles bellator]
MESYLKQYHDEEITDLLNNPDGSLHVSIRVNLTHLQRKQPDLYARLLQTTDTEMLRWNECLLRAQESLIDGNLFLETGFKVKQNCHTRFVNMPLVSSGESKLPSYPNTDNVGQFVQVKGTVIRMTSSRCLEYKRWYICTRCKRKVLAEAEYGRLYVFDKPGPCPAARESGCRGYLQAVSAQPQPENYRDYQEIRIQEIMSERRVPASLIVTLEDDLVDGCQPGDRVTVCGRLEHRSKPPIVGRRTEVTTALRANSLVREHIKGSWANDMPEHLLCVQAEWQEVLRDIGELAARDCLIQSIAPNIRGMYPVKLAVALTLASCTERPCDADQQSSRVRDHSHLLLVGDPGLAKSQLLKFASEIASRAVYTNGMGCSSAGLTAAAVKDEGEWELEAGALVLADGGICCIDEFNRMRETDKASIHEAMEQQTISVAKAGMVRKMSTRCVVLAATNPKKPFTMSDDEGPSAANIGIGGPLLSRFDIVLILRDIHSSAWDTDIATHLLTMALLDEEQSEFDRSPPLAHWELEKLQLHFAAIKDIHPTVSPEANVILGAYYKACRADPFRDPARTTARLLESLFRLAKAHARLLFRREVTPIDAITIIQLMEASWGFGKIGIAPYDLIKADLPLGPEQALIDRLLDRLQLNETSIRDSATVRPIDPNLLRRYQCGMIAKQKAKQATKHEQQSSGPAWQGTLTQQSPCSSTPPTGSSQLASSSSISKYTIQTKANLKKLQKVPTCDDEDVGMAKKRKQQTSEDTAPLASSEQSVCQITLSNKKQGTMNRIDALPTKSHCSVDTVGDDEIMSFQIESCGDRSLLGEDEAEAEPGIRTQTCQKLQQFEFAAHKTSNPSAADNNADASMHDTIKKANDRSHQASQYSYLFSDGEEDADDDLHFSDIEL